MTAPVSGTYDDHIVRSFRDDAIRTAVLIDDKFPTYAQTEDDEFDQAWRARNLYSYFHKRGLVCDIQNLKSGAGELGKLVEKLRKSDLIVLDYHLGDQGAKSLNILRSLAQSAHFNLVVLYTDHEDLTTVALRAATMMHGEPELLRTEEVDEGTREEIIDAIEASVFRPTAKQLADFVRTGKPPWAREACDIVQSKDNELERSHISVVARLIGTHFLARVMRNDVEVPESRLEMRCNVSDDGPRWVQAGHSFVAILNKVPQRETLGDEGEDEGKKVWNHLSKALLAWKPNLYRLMLSEIQNALELEALGTSGDWLDDDMCLGLGMHLLGLKEIEKELVDDNAVAGKVEELTDRFIDLIRRRLADHGQISVTGREVFKELYSGEQPADRPGENARQTRARALASFPVDQKPDWERQVIPKVNAFMVSDAFRGSHVTNGSILHDADSGHYYLCTTPACDLVPGRGANTVFLHLSKMEDGGGDTKHSAGERIMFEHNGAVMIKRVLNAKSKLLNLREALLPGGTTATKNADGEYIIATSFIGDIDWKQSEDASASNGSAKIISMQVVGQLRQGFADRFLNEAGKQLSRIGVDFIDH